MENEAEVQKIAAPSLVLCGMNTTEAVLFLVDRTPFVVGKDLSCDGVIMGADEISRRHAQIILREDGYFLRDMDSKNGTTLDGERLQPGNDYPLTPGSSIGLAMIRLTVSVLNI